MIFIRSSVVAAFVVGVGFTSLAAAQSKVWNFGDVTAPGACTSSSGGTPAYGNTVSCSEQPAGNVNTLAITAWSNTGAGATYANAAVNYHGVGSGIGVANRNEGATVTGSPNHSMDNLSSSDMLLLSFTSQQVLETVTLGWAYSDSDFQLLRWTGVGAPASISGQTAGGLLGGGINVGWDLVSTVNGGATGSTDTSYTVNGAGLSSSYWLISAFNSAFGGSSSGSTDGMKLLGVTAAGPSFGVAEPGSLALAGLALAGAAGLRRRRVQRTV